MEEVDGIVGTFDVLLRYEFSYPFSVDIGCWRPNYI